ncbi:MAG: glycosyltransferase family 2 protein [Goleter apudmare HA4340-LM2]|jgi:glycosyltransferase involved in cell wall biosynthesis|nr:glycosyltransferase family 2 protein [Goleter apudmare HA4340-LM2]
MATLNRTREISRFLEKLQSQTYQNLELIVVDQNPDNRLVEILQPYRTSLSIIQVRSEAGASRARNVGLRQASGDIIAFPDDDCWYPQDVLERLKIAFEEHPNWHGFTGSSAGDTYWNRSAGMVNSFNVWKRGIEYSIFLRREVVNQIGFLDENLGPGSGTSCWAGEGTDYLLRALKAGYKIYYDPTLEVHHPGPIIPNQNNSSSLNKTFHYAMGKGRVLRKSDTPVWFVAYQCAKPLGNSILGLIQQRPEKQQIAWSVLQGIIQGWRGVN